MARTVRDMPSIEMLRSFRLFRSCTEEEMAAIVRTGRQSEHARGSYFGGHPFALGEQLLLLVRGAVHITRTTADGAEVLSVGKHAVDLIEPGDLPPGDRIGVEVRAVGGPATVFQAPWDGILALLQPRREFLEDVVKTYRREVSNALAATDELASGDVMSRVARALAGMAQDHGQGTISITREELAEQSRASCAQVNRVLPRLRELMLIDYKPYSREIVVLQVEQLAALGRRAR